MNFLQWWILPLGICLYAAILVGCGDTRQSGEPEHALSSQKGAVAITVEWPGSIETLSKYESKAAKMNCTGITSVEIQIYGPPPTNAQLIPPWQASCDTGSGTINDIPATRSCTVIFIARNDSGQIVHYGRSSPVDIIGGQTASVSISAEHFVPNLISPQTGEPAQLSTNCQWSLVPNAFQYELRISESENLSAYKSFIVEDTGLIPTGLSAGVTYWCQVFARDRYGNISSGSNVGSFSLLLGSPTLDTPLDGAVVLPGDVTLNWHGPSEGLAYHLEVSTEADFSDIFLQSDTTPGVMSYLLSGIVAGQTYYWRIAARNGQDSQGIFSDSFSFTPSEASLDLTKPDNDSVLPVENLRLHWDPVGNRTYRVYLYRADDPDHWIDSANTGGATYYDPVGLEKGTSYLWRVEALESSAIVTHISARRKFATMQKPNLIEPQAGEARIINTFGFEWQNVPNAGYRIVIANDSSLTNRVIESITGADINHFSSENLNASQIYYWRVWPLTSDAVGLDEYASDIRLLRTLGSPPALLSPANGITMVKRGYDYSWTPATHAAGYLFLISEDSNPRISPAIELHLAQGEGTTTDIDDLPEAQWLRDGTRYYWQVFAFDSSGRLDAGSDIRSFNTVKSNHAEIVTWPDPRRWIAFGDYYFYAGNESPISTTTTLWRTDGTESGSTRVVDVINIHGAVEHRNVQNISSLCLIDNTLYFNAYSSSTGNEVCMVTNPAVPVVRVIDVLDDISSHAAGYFTKLGNLLFYKVKQGEGYSYYQERIKFYNPATGNTNYVQSISILNSIDNFFPFQDKLIFTARERETAGQDWFGKELWALRLPTSYTEPIYIIMHRIKDIEAGEGESYPSNFIAMDNFVLFTASNSSYGRELWKTDGTDTGTGLVKNICPGNVSANISALTENSKKDGFIYFWADDMDDADYTKSLYRTDGTYFGTQPVEEPGTENRILSGNLNSAIVNLNGTLYFRANDSQFGDELRCSDGTFEGTRIFFDLNPGPSGSGTNFGGDVEFGVANFLTLQDGHIYFHATDPTYGSEEGEIWRTDGTPAGTEVIESIPGPLSSEPWSVVFRYGKMYFMSGYDPGSWSLMAHTLPN